METPSNTNNNTNNNSIIGPIIASLQKEFISGLNELKGIGIATLKKSVANKIETNTLLSSGNKLLEFIAGDNQKNVDAIKDLQKDLSASSKSSIAAIKEQSKEFQGSIDNLSKVVNQPSIIKETIVNNDKETIVNNDDKETIVKPAPLPKMFTDRASLFNAPKLLDPVAQDRGLKVLKKIAEGNGLLNANAEELKSISLLTKKANKTESDSFSFEKMMARKLALNKKESEAEAAKKGQSSGKMVKEFIKDNGWLTNILGSLSLIGGVIVGFVGEVIRKIKSFKIVKSILKIFEPVKNFFSAIGKAFRSAASTFSKAFDFIKPVFNFIKGLGSGGKISKFFSAISKFFKIGIKIGATLAKSIPIIGQVIMIIEGLVFGVMGAFKGFTETEGNIIQKIAGGLIGFIKGAIEGVFGGLINLVIDGIGWLGGLLGFDNFKEMLYDFDINKYIGVIIDAIAMPAKLIIDFFSDFSENMKRVGGFFVSIGDSIMGGLEKIGLFFEPIIKEILDGFNAISSFFVSIGESIMNSFNAIGSFFSNIGEEIKSVGSSIKGFLKNGVTSLVKTVWDFIVDGVKKFFAMSPVGLISGAISGDGALENIQREVLKNVVPDPNKKYDTFSKETLMLKVMPDSLLEFVWGSKPSAAESVAARGSKKVASDKKAAEESGNPEAKRLAEEIAKLEADKQKFQKQSVELTKQQTDEMDDFFVNDEKVDTLGQQSDEAQRKSNEAGLELKQKREQLNLLLNEPNTSNQLSPDQMEKPSKVDNVGEALSETGAMNAAPVINVVNNNGGNVTNNSSQSTQNTIAESTDNVLAGSAMSL